MIKTEGTRNVLAPVVEHVHQRVPHLARRAKGAGVISVEPDLSAPSKHAIDGTRESDGEPLKPADHRLATFGLDEQMDVIVLDAEVQDSEISPRRFGDAATNGGEDRGATE